jgi:HEAT repeat protein
MTFRRRILEILRVEDLDLVLSELRQFQPRKLIKPLFSGICSADERVRWHAVAAMGPTVAALAAADMEAARVVMRRFMWSLNDESGGIGWGGPEAMGEVLAAHAGLAAEYAHILVAFMREDGCYLEYEPLQRGLMWGLGRLAQVRPELLRQKKAQIYLLPYLRSSDSSVRGLAARALGFLQAEEAALWIEALMADSSPVRFLEGRQLRTATVGGLARQAHAAITKTDDCHLRTAAALAKRSSRPG